MLKYRQILIFYFAFLFALSSFVFADTASNNAGTYEDENGYFALVTPEGWKKWELSTEGRSNVIFISPDDAAMLVVLAELDKYDLQDLLRLKKSWVDERKEFYPEGIFGIKRSAICGFDAVEVDFYIPKVMKKVMYFFYFDGVRFDLTYSVSKEEDFDKYKDAAFQSFFTLKAKRRALKKY